jgi:hypothetical protein
MINSRKKKSAKAARISFAPGGLRKRGGQRAKWIGPRLAGIMKGLAIAGVLCGIAIGLVLMEKYITRTVPALEDSVELELADVPAWVNEELKNKVYEAAQGGGEPLRLDEDTALSVQHNVARQVVWLDDIRVRTTHNCLRVEGRWRRPVALIQSGPAKFYIDAENVVLDFVPLADLPIVEIQGLSSDAETPQLGQVWRQDDLAAAVTILNQLDRMDRSFAEDKPLLDEINRIDVSNFNGHKNDDRPHIVLYAKDDTQIMWGAEVGKWQQYLESTDEEKLAKLYSYYKEYGTLSGGAKYINLRDPRDKIPLPIDRY